MARPIPPATFALKSWTIKMQNDKYFVAPTASFDDKTRWSKSYATLQHACTAIARKLAEEWTTRNKKRAASHGLKEDA
jgi:hypothetical protein